MATLTAWGTEWLVLFLWLGVLLIGFWKDNGYMKGSGAVIGLFLGITMFAYETWLGFILVIMNLGVLYYALFK